jgi:hypothetical protein
VLTMGCGDTCPALDLRVQRIVADLR